MLKKSLLFDNNFWEVIALISRVDNDENLDKLFKETPIDEVGLNQIFEFIKYFNFDVKIIEKDNQKYISIPNPKEKIQFIFSFSDWLSLQYGFYEMDKDANHYFQYYVQDKVNEIKLRFPGYNLFNFPTLPESKANFPNLKSTLGNDFIEKLEMAMLQGESLFLELKGGSKIDVFPRRVLFIEESLSLVGEDINEKCLSYFPLDEILNFNVVKNRNYKSIYTNLEVNDFISQIRKMNGNESRIILKVVSEDNIEFNPPFHLMENPCLITNYEGQKIYAATVEVSDEFFNWYHTYSDSFEILEPDELNEGYKDFLKRKIKSLKSAA
ncbi:MAG: WYL domain-containing protein [Bdellovibrionales bacterium]|jgi:hypothetical protein|nr:WYL domain-containing protein [Bdellovibrionales bacterium]